MSKGPRSEHSAMMEDTLEVLATPGRMHSHHRTSTPAPGPPPAVYAQPEVVSAVCP